MSRLASMLGALVLASLTGCTLVSSVHPLSDAKNSIADDRLVGEWLDVDLKTGKASRDDKLIIRKADEGIAYEAAHSNEQEQMKWFTTQIGDRRFISVPVRRDEATVLYMILQYELRDDELRIFLMDPDKTAATIAEGHVEGTVVREDPPAGDPNVVSRLKQVTLTASSEQLCKFLASKMGQAVMHTGEPAMLLKRAPK